MSYDTPTFLLNDNRPMPQVGLGVYKLLGDNEAESALNAALDAGYRLIDTASVYKNEESVGKAIRFCSLPREDLFITSKVWNTAQRMGDIEGAFNRSLDRLKLDYVDLYLIHWPVPGCYAETWKVLEKLHQSGRAKSIGVSNFGIPHLEHLFETSGIIPAVNQIECHPLWNRSELVNYCQERGIVVQAYAPVARGAYSDREILTHIGEKYHKPAVQIGLRWLIQRNIAIIPKSSHKDRIQDNIDVFDFQLTENEMKTIDTMDEHLRTAGIPEDMVGQGVE
ncbi:MAG TPA: aldo/keto reductase [Candidatus Pelethocola excrementipullorum]|nr:aldo/keto reductase [Candidatus Pelethocola excrementipullorum]